jgi:hypothetical protein
VFRIDKSCGKDLCEFLFLESSMLGFQCVFVQAGKHSKCPVFKAGGSEKPCMQDSSVGLHSGIYKRLRMCPGCSGVTVLGFQCVCTCMQDEEKIYLQRYMNSNGTDIAWDFIKEAMKSVSATCMIMMQDILRLDNSCRMNSPGKAAGNWAWRLPGDFKWNSISKEAAELRTMAVMFDRCAACLIGLQHALRFHPSL